MGGSIRLKLFSYILATILIFAALLFVFNTFFAEKYYIYHKKNTLLGTGKELSVSIEKAEADSGKKNDKALYEEDALVKEINALEKKLGGTIVVGNDRGEIYYPSDERHKGMIAGLIRYDLKIPPKDKYEEWKRKDENSFFMITKDPGYDINTLRYQIQREDGLILLIWVPMAEISENASLSNRFTLLVGLLTILITALLTLLISGRFTKPIMEMNDITRRMSKLDFTRTLRIHSKDELGELSESINHMSQSLNEAIEKLNRANNKLSADIDNERKLEKLRREFVANVSHELKTPVFLIQGYAEGLRTNIADNEERREFYCSVIMEEAEKMDTLIRELLDLSRLEQGGFTIEKEYFHLTDELLLLLDKYKNVLEERGIQVDTDVTPGITVYADRLRTEQVMTNYLVNALHYVDERKLVKITLNPVGDRAVFSVYNTSMAIPEEELAKLWQSFYKLNAARTREGEGTGLGLSIVRAIQEAQGCAYGVYNAEGGVVFWCDFERK